MKLMHIIFYIFSLVVINTLYAQDYIKLSGEALEKSPRTISEQLSQTQSNDVQNTGSASNPKLYPPKINQLGYLPKAEKKFTILADSIKPNDSFQIIDHSTSEIVFSGNLSNEEIDGETLHGETVLRGDFTSCENTGRYRVKVGRWESNPFSISVNVYNLLFLQAERTLYICRANTVLNDAITGINHNMGHPQDFDINGKDLSGGWYNAGDYGKWTHCAAITVAHLLWLFRLDSDAFQSDTIIIPESGNGIPDILDEARWGLVWLMKMQQSDGSVYHKVDSEPNFGWGNAPEDDQLTRTVKFQSKDISSPSTVDAGVFCGVMALGYIMYKTIEPSFADSCRLHAMTSWEWLKENKEDIQEDPYYMDKNVRDELAWAAAGIYTLTEDTTALSELNSYLLSSGINVVNWNNPSLFGFLEVYFSEIASDELKTSIRNAIIQKADNLKSHIYI